jgi:DNA-binding transcriptional regulator LsrR (DeoR family)
MALTTEELKELSGIKKLLMLQLLAIGYKQKDLAAVLGVSEATLSGMLPKGIAKGFGSKKGAEG